MASVNKVIIVGNLGNDPEVRSFDNGGKIATISVATTDRWNDRNTGEPREATEWHRITFNNRLAEIVEQYLRKGSSVYVEGSLHTRKWTDQQGIERYSTEIRAQSMQMLGSRQGGQGGGDWQGNQGGYNNQGGYQGGGFNNQGGNYPRGGNANQGYPQGGGQGYQGNQNAPRQPSQGNYPQNQAPAYQQPAPPPAPPQQGHTNNFGAPAQNPSSMPMGTTPSQNITDDDIPF